MFPSRRILWCLILSAVSAGLHAADPPSTSKPTLTTPEAELPTPSNYKQTGQLAMGMFGTIKCDAHGGVYYRPIAGAGSAFENPVVRIEADKSSTTLNLNSAPGVPTSLYIFAFDVDPSGRVYAVVGGQNQEADPGLYIVSFSKDGGFLSRTKLDMTFRPAGIFLKLPNDEFLVSGLKDTNKPPEQRAFVAIFRDGGSLRLLSETPEGQEVKKDPNRPGILDPVLQFGQAVRNEAGEIYLLKATSPPHVEVFSSAGKLVRSMELPPPFKEAAHGTLYLSGSNILLMYQTSDPEEARKSFRLYYTLYSGLTGKPVITYLQDHPAILGCVNGTEAVFLKGMSGRLVLGTTELK